MNAIQKMNGQLKRIRSTAGDMTLQKLQVLLVIAMAGDQGISMSEISRQATLSSSNTSKLVHGWTKLTAQKKPGPGFVTADPDPMDLATKYCKLTPKGRDFVNTVIDSEGSQPATQ